MTREEAIENNKNLRMYMRLSDKNQSYKFLEENYIALDMAIKALEQEPKTGHWKKKEDDTCWWYVCSECEQEPLKNRWNDDDVLSAFCPNCGAKMFEPQERSDKE